MSADLTREQAREQIVRAIVYEESNGCCEYLKACEVCDCGMDGVTPSPENYVRERRKADVILTVLWPVVESLRAELAHAHTVIARHVEPLRKPCRPEAGDCCDGSAHTWQPSEGSRLPDRVDGNRPSDALCGDLTGEGCGPGVSGRVDETGGSE